MHTKSHLFSTTIRYVKYFAALIGVLASLIAILGIFSSKIPQHSFEVSCAVFADEEGFPTEEANLTNRRNITEAMSKLVSFAQRHTAEVVFLNLEVRAVDGAKTCPMHREIMADFYGLTESQMDNIFIGYGITNLGERKEDGTPTLFYDQELRVLPEGAAGSYVVILPAISRMERGGLFSIESTKRGEDFYYSVSGPFTMHYVPSNGEEAVFIEPVKNTELFWQEIGCMKQRLEYPSFLRPFIPCI